MGGTPRYFTLSTFPSANSYSVVAPFASDITTSHSTGYVRYSESFNSQLNVVSEHIRSETRNLILWNMDASGRMEWSPSITLDLL